MIQDSLDVIVAYDRLVVGLLLSAAVSCLLLARVLRFLFGTRLTPGEYLALGLSGWILPSALLAYLWRMLGLIPALTLFIALTIILLRSTARVDGQTQELPASPLVAFALLTFVPLSLLLRLAFVSQATLPSYFDSAQHYLFIKEILQNTTTASNPLTSYYHQGFHTLAAFFASLLGAEIAQTMLILGQTMLAILPVSVFLLVRHATRSDVAGLLSVVLAGFGWYMPAHVMNWGKYPALTSLSLLPFVFSVAYLLTQYQHELSEQKRRWLYGLLGLGVVVTVLAHTRAGIVLGVTLLAWLMAKVVQRYSAKLQYVLLSLVVLVIVLESVYIQQHPLLARVFDPYLVRGLWITVMTLLLALFAWRVAPHVMWMGVLFISLLLGSLFIPVSVPGYGPLTLLDRPYVQMLLFLPLTVLGGVGLAGLGQSLTRLRLPMKLRSGLAGMLIGGVVIAHALSSYDFYPENCCVIVGSEDLLAIDWLHDNLPATARLGIAVTEMNVVPSQAFEGYNGTDGGVWITPLTGRRTLGVPVAIDLSQRATLDELCEQGITHLYVGETGQMFNESQINARPEWYGLLFALPMVRTYEVIGCGE